MNNEPPPEEFPQGLAPAYLKPYWGQLVNPKDFFVLSDTKEPLIAGDIFYSLVTGSKYNRKFVYLTTDKIVQDGMSFGEWKDAFGSGFRLLRHSLSPCLRGCVPFTRPNADGKGFSIIKDTPPYSAPPPWAIEAQRAKPPAHWNLPPGGFADYFQPLADKPAPKRRVILELPLP